MSDQTTENVQKDTSSSGGAGPKTTPVISQTPLPRKPKQDRPADQDPGIWRTNRRNVLAVTGWMGFLGFIIISTVGALRYMFPRVLFEPPTKFKAGFPQDFMIGEVSEKYKDEKRVWIVREKEGFYALISICTHLGCTPRWLPGDNKFKCPCHGSGFYRTGVNFEGPAPRPLERAFIGIADDGQLQIDRSVKFLYEKNEWGRIGSFLPYTG
ncbi:MAG: Rieske 2Fe-2S domain-containing protein [Bacteroidota bacterium]